MADDNVDDALEKFRKLVKGDLAHINTDAPIISPIGRDRNKRPEVTPEMEAALKTHIDKCLHASIELKELYERIRTATPIGAYSTKRRGSGTKGKGGDSK
jgi:hypothetical protein